MRKVILVLILPAVCAFAPCKMKYKEHYRITSLQLELLKVNGENKYHESILDPVTTITGTDSIMLYLRFENEFISTGVKTKKFPLYGSLGPVDTVQSLRVLMKTSGFDPVDLDSALFNSETGKRIELSSPNPLPGYYTSVRNPFVSFSSIQDFISKFNSRKEDVLFENLKDNGLILGLNQSIIPGDTNERKLDFVVTLSLTNGKTFSDTASATFGYK
jgi:hypothetical protein